MNRDFNSQEWADHHEELTRAIDKFIKLIGTGFACLTRRQFSAPWRHDDDLCADNRP